MTKHPRQWLRCLVCGHIWSVPKKKVGE